MPRNILIGCVLLSGAVAQGSTQVVVGEPVMDQTRLELPFYFYSTDGVTAGQFDLTMPGGWKLNSVHPAPIFAETHELDSDEVGDGRLRVVFYSKTNAVFQGGTLGRVVLAPLVEPSTEIDTGFLDALFADAEGVAFLRSPGFPTLQILGQPMDQEIAVGQTATLSVATVGIDPSYSWYEGGTGDTSTPVGGNSAIFTTPALSDTTEYWVRITDPTDASVDSRTATVTVSGEAIIVLNPTSRVVDYVAGSNNFSVSASAGTAWTATSNASWVSLTSASGNGDGAVAFTYSQNNGFSNRSATITVGTATFTLTQERAPSLFADYDELPGSAEGWKPVAWFGWVIDRQYPFVYSLDHGWLYFFPGGTEQGGFYLYSIQSDLGWLYTSRGIHETSAKWLYSFQYGSYLQFLPTGSPAGRWFYHPTEDRWFVYPENP